jgi:hypothetical protein
VPRSQTDSVSTFFSILLSESIFRFEMRAGASNRKLWARSRGHQLHNTEVAGSNPAPRNHTNLLSIPFRAPLMESVV